MKLPASARRALAGPLLLACLAVTGARLQATSPIIVLNVVDENGLAVPGAQIEIIEPGFNPQRRWSDLRGECAFTLVGQQLSYQLRIEKAGFYQAFLSRADARLNSLRVVLAHEQIVREQVSVTASAPGIDTQQDSDKATMNTAEIVNIPYQTSRDIRYLLPFNPGVIQDATEQVHVAGSESWETLYSLDGFDIRSPEKGTLDMRISVDAVRSIEAESTRIPVKFGRITGGVIAFYTGMGDNKFRFNATNFIPSFRDLNGIRFDKFVPRFTFSGPVTRDRVWFYDGLEVEYDNIYISELPANANTDPLLRGSNLLKFQGDATPAHVVTAGLLVNDYHSPYDGISSLTPQQSTTNRDIVAWLPYLRDQWSLGGALLDLGVGVMRFRDGHEPHGTAPYEITPELSRGSYFENLTGRSQRIEGNASLYLPARQWAGKHDISLGVDLNHTAYNQDQSRAPVSYLREDGTLDRQSVFSSTAPFALHNAELGGYIQDRWQASRGLLIDPGVRFDWDEIIRRPLPSPRVAAVYAPRSSETTKISAGIGLYYEHTQMDYLAQTFAGARKDTYYQANGVTPLAGAEATLFTVSYPSLRRARALNWSLAVEQKLPLSVFVGAAFMEKRTSDVFTFVNQSGPASQSGDFVLTNARQDRYNSFEVGGRRVFSNAYTLFASYIHSSARTNAALGYLPTPSPLGAQQSGPLPWDAPSRVVSWGWLPLPLPVLKKRWDFVYLFEHRTGFPYTSVNEAQQVVGAAGSRRFPDFFDFSPGLEWKFHFHALYFGLRGVIENATGSENPAVVNSVVNSPQFGKFSEGQGRAFTARIRLIETK